MDAASEWSASRHPVPQTRHLIQCSSCHHASNSPADLIGRQILIRYAERASFASAADRDDALLESAISGQLNGELSVIPREKMFIIVGIIETDPSAGMGGFGGGRLYLPVNSREA